MQRATFATAINCIDGRAQQAVTDWVRIHCQVDYVDMVTLPGPDGVFTQGPANRIADIREYVGISVNAHGSRTIALAGHYDCAAFGVPREEHAAAIRAAAQIIQRWQLPVRVVGLWVNEHWQAELVDDSAADQP